MDDDSLLSCFLSGFKNNYPRYYYKIIASTAALLTDDDKSTAHTLLKMFAEPNVYNANYMKGIAS